MAAACSNTPPLPAPFLARMEQMLGEEFPLFLASYAAPPTAGLRVNTLKLTPQEFQAVSPFPLQLLPWTEAGFLLGDTAAITPAPGRHPYHAAGLYYLQDPSAMAVVEALAPLPGEKVLDLAAAPGGKTTHLAARMQGRGLLVANEIHPRRVWDLAENLERWGVSNAVITNEAPERLAAEFGPYFDRVLLDAPCSGEGLFRKTPAARTEWSASLVQSCAARQSAILNQAARLVRPGGWLVYSTCTFSLQEDEALIARFLAASHAGEEFVFDLVSLQRLPGLDPAQAAWAAPDDPLAPAYPLERAARIWPHRSPGEGHFMALMQRNDPGSSALGQALRPPHHKADPDLEQARRLYTTFCRSTLESDPFAGPLALAGAYLYYQPFPLPSLQGLKVIHPGLWLGTVKKERFEPSHALALALQSGHARRSLPLDAAEAMCASYLHGETLEAGRMKGDGDGWSLVSLSAPGSPRTFPLGWGRRLGDQVKNAYPKGLRH